MVRSYGTETSEFNQYVSKFAHLLRFGGIGVLLVSLISSVLMSSPEVVGLGSDLSFVLLGFGVGLEVFYHFLEGEVWA